MVYPCGRSMCWAVCPCAICDRTNRSLGRKQIIFATEELQFIDHQRYHHARHDSCDFCCQTPFSITRVGYLESKILIQCSSLYMSQRKLSKKPQNRLGLWIFSVKNVNWASGWKPIKWDMIEQFTTKKNLFVVNAKRPLIGNRTPYEILSWKF